MQEVPFYILNYFLLAEMIVSERFGVKYHSIKVKKKHCTTRVAATEMSYLTTRTLQRKKPVATFI